MEVIAQLSNPDLVSCVLRCVTMVDDEGLGWIPDGGTRLTRDELLEIMRTLRALIAGTERDEPNRAHAVSIAYVVTMAIDRERGNQ